MDLHSLIGFGLLTFSHNQTDNFDKEKRYSKYLELLKDKYFVVQKEDSSPPLLKK